jgi:predicted  nucleic acid-binding Zn-ribbon protein
VNPELKALIQLQEIDLKILELDKQIQNVPSQIQNLQQILDTGNARLTQYKETLIEKQKARRKAEQDVEALRAKLSKLKDQLMSVKTNREYTAMLKEIEVYDADIRKGEDQILEMMESVDQLSSNIEITEKHIKTEAVKTEAEQRELEARIETHQTTIEHLEAERRATLQMIDVELLERYRKITTYRKGIGIAEARDECCMACRVRLRPQVFNDVKKNDRIITCDSCGRILFWIPPSAAPQAGAERQPPSSVSAETPETDTTP